VAAILIVTVALLVLGMAAYAWFAVVMLALIGVAEVMFNIVGVSLRQAIVPDQLIGRVVSAYRMVGYGAVPAGSILGGVAGRTLGLRAPFLLGAAVLTTTVGLLALPIVNNRTVHRTRMHAAERNPTSEP
jgi:MFS family permease